MFEERIYVPAVPSKYFSNKTLNDESFSREISFHRKLYVNQPLTALG